MENIQPTVEELAAEVAATQVVKEDEIRESIISEYGFDEIDDAERIEKMVAKEIESNKKLSQAIGQKISWRTKATEVKPTPPQDKTNVFDPEILDKKLDEKLNERLEKRDLESLDYPDELKTEIQKVAKILGKSIKESIKDPYIASKIEAHNKEVESNEASISRSNKSGSKVKTSFENPPEVDIATPEGQKKWDEWKEEMKKLGH